MRQQAAVIVCACNKGVRMKKLLLFTDLDGTLLDHNDYSWDAASPALQLLQENDFPVVFVSSKTAVEISRLKQLIGNVHPFIAENGALASIPRGYFNHVDTGENLDSHIFAKSYSDIISLLASLREHYLFKFIGFNDLSIEELVAITNLSVAQAQEAKQRQASEPLIWNDTAKALNEFKQQLAGQGLRVTAGGRFYHVMSDVDKGQAVQWLLQRYQQAEPDTQWVSIGLGDSFNDVKMLEVVDYPVFISNSGTRQPEIKHIKNLQRPQLPGPAGWNQAVLNLMTKILARN